MQGQADQVKAGQIVYSKAGHDKGRLYLVMEQIAEDRVLLTDGRYRPLDKLKVKNIRHIKLLADCLDQASWQQIRQPAGDPGSKNAQVRKILATYATLAGKKGPNEKMEEI